MPDNVAALTARLRDGARATADSPRPAVKAAAQAAKDVMLSTAASARTKGITVRVRNFESASTGSAASVRFGPNAGWVQIQNGPTQAHFIGPRGGGTLRHQSLESGFPGAGRRSARSGRLVVSGLLGAFGGTGVKSRGRGAHGRHAVRTPYGPKAHVFVKGVHRKGWVERGIKAAAPVATKVFVAEEHKAILKGFHG